MLATEPLWKPGRFHTVFLFALTKTENESGA